MINQLISYVFGTKKQLQPPFELKSIRLGIKIQYKLYEEVLATAEGVEDNKGNLGWKGILLISNLRIIWYSLKDKNVNISIGIDTIYNMQVKEMIVHGYEMRRYLLSIKAIKENEVKFQFRFMAFKEREGKTFNLIHQIYQLIASTKKIRQLLVLEQPFRIQEKEEYKSQYDNCKLKWMGSEKQGKLIFTNARAVFACQLQHKYYSIPWIAILAVQKGESCIRITAKQMFKDIQFELSSYTIRASRTIQRQIMCFWETYPQNPFLGINISQIKEKVGLVKGQQKANHDYKIQQFEQCKILTCNPNSYNMNEKGTIKQTFYNQQLGIMMQALPQGSTRKQLWSILGVQ